MPQFNIHWKGCPHRHIPHIRVASSHHGTVRSRSLAHVAAEDAVRLPFGLALEKAREQQRMRVCKQERSSVGSSGGRLARRRASQRAKWYIQIFGRNSSREDLVAKEHGSNGAQRASSIHHHPQSPLRRTEALAGDAPSLSTRRPEASYQDGCYSSVHVVELPQHCNNKKAANQHTPKRTDGGEYISSRRVRGEYGSTGSIDRARKRSTYSRPRPLEKSGVYDPRLPIKRACRRTKSTPSQYKTSGQSRRPGISSRSSAIGQKLSCSSTSSRQATKASMSSSKPLDSVLSFTRISEIPSRTSSQREALKRFSRDLERHLIAQEAIRNASMCTSSTSTSCISAHTIVEFTPYLAEFQAAGLAVTSAEQRNNSSGKSKSLPPPKDGAEIPIKTIEEGNTADNNGPNGPNDGSETSVSTDTISSCSTIVPFTSLEELPVLKRVVSSPARKVPAKKTLPWLYKTEVPDMSRLPPSSGIATKEAETAPSNSISRSSKTTIIDSTPQHGENESKPKESDHFLPARRPTDIRFIDMEYSSTARKSTGMGQPKRSDLLWLVQSNQRSGSIDSIHGGRSKTFSVKRTAKTSRQPLPLSATPVATLEEDSGAVTAYLAPGSNSHPRLPQQTGPVGNVEVDLTASGRRENFPTRAAATIQNPIRTAPIDPTSAYRLSTGPFRDSPRLLEPQRTFPVGNLGHATAKTAPADTTSSHGTLSPQAPSRSPPSPPPCDQCQSWSPARTQLPSPSETSAQLCTAHALLRSQQYDPSISLSSTHSQHASHPPQSPLANSKPTRELLKTSMYDHYGYENPSVSKQVPEEVCERYHSAEEKIATHLPGASSGPHGTGDPIKRKPTSPYKTPEPFLDSSDVATISTFGSTATYTAPITAPTEGPENSQEDIFKGLQIAMAAACDEDVDAWIKEMSGCGVRKFLADLSAFERWGFNALVQEARRTARKRRKEYGKRVRGHEHDHEHVHVHERGKVGEAEKKPRGKDRKMGLVAADDGGQHGLPVEEMLRSREARASENVRERAVGMEEWDGGAGVFLPGIN